MQEPTRRGRRGRLVRELVPIGAAAGAAALAVTIVVGGTTAELVSPAQQGPWPVATSPVQADRPPVVTNAPAPRRIVELARSAGDLGVELAAGPVALVTGSLVGSRPGGTVAGGTASAAAGRPIALVPPASGPSETVELTAPELLAVVAPEAQVEPTLTTATATSSTTGPGKSAEAKRRTPKVTSPRSGSREAIAPTTVTAAGAPTGSASADRAQNDVAGQGQGREPAAGQARSAEARRSAPAARSQAR